METAGAALGGKCAYKWGRLGKDRNPAIRGVANGVV